VGAIFGELPCLATGESFVGHTGVTVRRHLNGANVSDGTTAILLHETDKLLTRDFAIEYEATCVFEASAGG
jgi:hypothetical protein